MTLKKLEPFCKKHSEIFFFAFPEFNVVSIFPTVSLMDMHHYFIGIYYLRILLFPHWNEKAQLYFSISCVTCDLQKTTTMELFNDWNFSNIWTIFMLEVLGPYFLNLGKLISRSGEQLNVLRFCLQQQPGDALYQSPGLEHIFL